MQLVLGERPIWRAPLATRLDDKILLRDKTVATQAPDPHHASRAPAFIQKKFFIGMAH